jgi:hypothetical protein
VFSIDVLCTFRSCFQKQQQEKHIFIDCFCFLKTDLFKAIATSGAMALSMGILALLLFLSKSSPSKPILIGFITMHVLCLPFRSEEKQKQMIVNKQQVSGILFRLGPDNFFDILHVVIIIALLSALPSAPRNSDDELSRTMPNIASKEWTLLGLILLASHAQTALLSISKFGI